MTIQIQYGSTRSNLQRMKRAMEPVGLGSSVTLLAGPIHQWFQQRAASRFASEGDGASGKWADLAPATHSWRQSQGFPAEHPINVRTGDLKTLLTEEKPTVGHDGIGTFLAFPGSAQTRGRRPQKMRQAAGLNRSKSGKSTARPVVAWGPIDVAFVHRTFQNFIMGKAK